MPNKTIFAIIALAAIAITALLKDINSWILISCVTGIAGLGGFALGKYKH
ncbi:hypothetical protein ES708_30031 [subsurface metagenome]